MEKILAKIHNQSKEIYLLAGDLLEKAINTTNEKEHKLLLNAMESLADISIVLIDIWADLKEKCAIKKINFDICMSKS